MKEPLKRLSISQQQSFLAALKSHAEQEAKDRRLYFFAISLGALRRAADLLGRGDEAGAIAEMRRCARYASVANGEQIPEWAKEVDPGWAQLRSYFDSQGITDLESAKSFFIRWRDEMDEEIPGIGLMSSRALARELSLFIEGKTLQDAESDAVSYTGTKHGSEIYFA